MRQPTARRSQIRMQGRAAVRRHLGVRVPRRLLVWPLFWPGLLFLVACAAPAAEPPAGASGAEAASGTPAGLVACSDPRPEVCTREFRPVCAQRDTGVRCVTAPCDEATEWVTKSNACVACSDSEVIAHRPGSCDREGPAPSTLLDY